MTGTPSTNDNNTAMDSEDIALSSESTDALDVTDQPLDAAAEPLPAEPKAEDSFADAEQAAPVVPRICATVHADVSPFSSRLDKRQAPIYVMRMNADEIWDALERYPLVALTDQQDRPLSPWEIAAKEGMKHSVMMRQYINAVPRLESHWQQDVQHQGKYLNISRVGNARQENGKEMTGDEAIAKFQHQYGMGSMVKFPLWHTGLWCTIKAPSDSRLNVLMELVALEKTTLGRSTNGLTFSGVSVWLVETLMSLARECIRFVNLKDYTDDKFMNLLSVHDLPVILWGMACAIYPNGYNASQPCLSDPNVCKHITKELLALSKLSWTDFHALTKEQLAHMADPKKMHTVEDVMKYQEYGLLSTIMSHSFEVETYNEEKKKLTINLQLPSVATYISASNKWVNEIIAIINNSFSDKVSDDRRDAYITKQSVYSTLRQYAHFFKNITFADGSYVAKQDDIANILNNLSSDVEVTKAITAKVQEFIDLTVLNLIALPKYDCPACGKPQTVEESKHPYLIPLEVASFFFTLVGLKL